MKQMPEKVVKAALSQLLGRVSAFKSSQGRHWDSFTLNHGGQRFSGISLFIKGQRVADVTGSLALALLDAREINLPANHRHLFLIVTRTFGKPTIGAIGKLMKRHGGDNAWGIIDYGGRLYFRDPLNDKIIDQVAEIPFADREVAVDSKKGPPLRLVSDLNLWMLKILILRKVPEPHWQGPRDRIMNPTHLGRVANVSIPTAHTFVRSLMEMGHIERSRNGLRLIRQKDLLSFVFLVLRQRQPSLVPVRSIFGMENDWSKIAANCPRRYALGGFLAVDQHGVRHGTGGQPWLHIEGSESEYLSALQYDVCTETEAEFYIAKPRYEQAVFRGAVSMGELKVVDLLQTALDVVHQQPRGLEQAEFIIDRIMEYGASK